MHVRPAVADDAAAITDIYNSGIAEGGATFETRPHSLDQIHARLAATDRYPIVVAEEAGEVIGWAGVGPYRARACYAGIGEFSVYVAPGRRGHGVGRHLLAALVDAARDCGFWKLVSRVFPYNQASLKAARAVGFREAGTYEKHGFLAGRWQDVVIVERLIPENQTPNGLRFRQASDEDWTAIAALLDAAGLPLAGAQTHLRNFVLAVRDDEITGCASYEDPGPPTEHTNGTTAIERPVLLRSVALRPAERGTGAGRLLVERTLDRARRQGATSAILLTTTAEAFFAHLGFVRMTRADVPPALLGSAELTGACPSSAVIMRRVL
jgi:L-amino acid N-acyltransferase YncA